MKSSPELWNAILDLKKERRLTFVLYPCRGTASIQLVNGCSFAFNFRKSLDFVLRSRWVIEVQHLTQHNLQCWNTGLLLKWLFGLDSHSLLIIVSMVNVFPNWRKGVDKLFYTMWYQVILWHNQIWVGQFCTFQMQSALETTMLPIHVSLDMQ